MKRLLGVDVSRYQPDLDPALLKANALGFVIAKATQGDYSVDKLLVQHLDGARNAGLKTGAYHWCDPMVSGQGQIDLFVRTVEKLPVDFLAVDVEQYWADWAEWREKKITKIVAPSRINDNAQFVAEQVKRRTGKRVLIYTRTSFINEFARPMLKWVNNWPLWLAQYPIDRKVKMTWDYLRDHFMPLGVPTLPAGSSQWHFWQFSGDDFTLPGCSTPLDVDLFNGDNEDLANWIGGVDVPLPPVVETGKVKLRVLRTMNIRSGPGTGYADVGDLQAGQEVELEDLGGMSAWVQIGDGKWAAAEHNGTRYLEIIR